MRDTKGVQNTDFLQAITLLATWSRRLRAIARGATPENAPGVSCKRKEILDLELEEYECWAEPVTVGFERAAELLKGQCLFDARDLPYVSQLAPLAATLVALGERASDPEAQAKLIRWYWCGVFGELYSSGVETRFARDLVDLLAWIDGGPEPSTITDANFAPARLLTMRTRNSAAYKGVAALLLRNGAIDFKTGVPTDEQRYRDNRVDIHTIFPSAWADKQRIPPGRIKSIINKTPLTAGARALASKAPSVYVNTLETNLGRVRVDAILGSHAIEPDHLRVDDFEAFFRARTEALVALLEAAMGKPVSRSASPIEAEPPADEADTDDEEQEGLLGDDVPRIVWSGTARDGYHGKGTTANFPHWVARNNGREVLRDRLFQLLPKKG